MKTSTQDQLIDLIDRLIDTRVDDLETEFAHIDADKFVGTNQWLIRCDGKTIWVSCETQNTYFDDDDTVKSGPQSWDHSSFEQGEDEDEEEYEERFADSSRPEFPREEVRERVAELIHETVTTSLTRAGFDGDDE